MAAPSPSYRITIRIKYANKVGNLAALTAAIADAGGSVGAIDNSARKRYTELTAAC